MCLRIVYVAFNTYTFWGKGYLISSQTGEHPKPCSLQLQYLVEHENLLCADIGYMNIAMLVR